MDKFRIIRDKSGNYYPQERSFFIYRYFYNSIDNRIKFQKLSMANKFIDIMVYEKGRKKPSF